MMTSDLHAFGHDEPPTLIRRRPEALEKRGGARLPIEMDVTVEGAAQRFQATSGDLSSGGMFVVTQRAIPVGTQVMLGFTLPNDTVVEVLGVVQWQTCGGNLDVLSGFSREGGLGLAFFCLAPEVKALLEDFCSARELLYYAR